MSITIRLRKADLEILAIADAVMDGRHGRVGSAHSRAWSSLMERVTAAEMRPRKPKPSISVNAAVTAFRGVLGNRLVMPAGNPGPGWWSQLQSRLNASGMTEALCTEAARAAGSAWRGPIKAESIIRQADVLLSEAGAEANAPAAPQEVEDMQDL